MNKVILVGKLIDVKRVGNSFLYTIGVSGGSDIVECYNKFDKSEYKGEYIHVEGFLSEKSGRTAVLTNEIKRITTTFRNETFWYNRLVYFWRSNKAEYYVHSHDHILEQVVSRDMFKLLKALDEMVKSDKPINVFEKYKQLFQKMSNLKNEIKVKEHTFF